MKKIDEKKKFCDNWFKQLRDQICLELENFENGEKTFKKQRWYRNKNEDLGGGGVAHGPKGELAYKKRKLNKTEKKQSVA